MRIAAVESSCDETSVAVLSDHVVAANLIYSQDFHATYGGVVPELSSRAHLQKVVPLFREALAKSGLQVEDLTAVAATEGPGLIGALLVGYTFAKSLAFALEKPFIPVNHIEGHIFSGFLSDSSNPPVYPFLSLVVSGGHSMLLLVQSPVKMIRIGTTVDDAVGEAFDKVAKMLGLGYPGGPAIQKAAAAGDPSLFSFPIAQLKKKYHFSFSGLKTSVLRHLQSNFSHQEPTGQDVSNIAASFQHAAISALVLQTREALRNYRVKSLVLAGGVAANALLRNEFIALGAHFKIPVTIPDISFCGDNAAMIAYRAEMLYDAGISFDSSRSPFPSFQSDFLVEEL